MESGIWDGVAVIHNGHMNAEFLEPELQFMYIEHMGCTGSFKNSHLRLCVVYCSPLSKKKRTKKYLFQQIQNPTH